jgi:hypothetical protein
LVEEGAVSEPKREKWGTARSSGSARVRCRGGVATCTRCRARSCAARGKCVSVRAGTRTLLSASSGMPGVSRARARAGPMGGLVGRRRLVELDGGAWDLLVKELVLASLLRHSPTGGLWSPRGERERAR